jgi:hypothetical protein
MPPVSPGLVPPLLPSRTQHIMLKIDHLLWAVPDLHAGIAYFEQLTGIEAAEGGSHPGRGTRNALLSFGNGQYIELLGPDPEQDVDNLPNDFGRAIKSLPSAGLFTFAMGCIDMTALAASAQALALPFRGPVASSRQQPDGTTIHWRVCHTDGTPFGRYLPFYIDWLETPHPSVTVPGGLQLLDFDVMHPQGDELAALYQRMGVGVRVRRGDRPGMRAVIQAGGKEIILSSVG